MKASRLRSLFPMAAAALGLLAGCDYWRNLVDDKDVTRVPLTIQVQDAFTGQPLENIQCKDTLRGIWLSTDAGGTFHVPDAGTGSYAFECFASRWYYERRMQFDVRDGGTVIIGMARHGGQEWYHEEPEHWVRIVDTLTLLRYPRKIAFDAYPHGTIGKFTYEWTFVKNKTFNRPFDGMFDKNQILSITAGSGGIKEGPDTVIVTVKANLAGMVYVIGSDTLPIEWARNRLPICTKLETNAKMVLVGCEGRQNAASVNVFFEGHDPDEGGHCDSVVLESKDSNSAFGKIRMQARCDDPNKSVKFGLRSPFYHGQTQALFTTATLSVSFWDDNNEHLDTSVSIQVKTNTIPTVIAEKLSPGTIFFTGEPVSYRITATDTDGILDDMYFDWDSTTRSITPSARPAPSSRLDETTSYSYPAPATARVRASAIDNCLESGSYVLPEVLEIRDNTPPKIILTPTDFPYRRDTVYQVRLSVTDKDVSDNLDRFTQIVIDWGDGQVNTASMPIGKIIRDSLLLHRYANPPAKDGDFKLSIQASDSHLHGSVEIREPVPAFRP